MIECRDTQLIYRNPHPNLRAVHAWHPSLARGGGDELLASFDLGQAVESLDYRRVVRSVAVHPWVRSARSSAPDRLVHADGPVRHLHDLRRGPA